MFYIVFLRQNVYITWNISFEMYIIIFFTLNIVIVADMVLNLKSINSTSFGKKSRKFGKVSIF